MLESITREPGRASRDGGWNERPRRGPARRDDVGNQGENERHGASLKFIRSRDAGPPAGPPAGRGALPPGLTVQRGQRSSIAVGRPRRGSRDQGQLPVRDGEAAESNGRNGCWAGGPRGRGSMRGPGHTREDVPWGRLAIGEGRRRETRPGNRRGAGQGDSVQGATAGGVA